jgi:hypothetical protein
MPNSGASRASTAATEAAVIQYAGNGCPRPFSKTEPMARVTDLAPNPVAADIQDFAVFLLYPYAMKKPKTPAIGGFLAAP